MQFDTHRALAHVRHLACEIGARLVGSPGADRAAEYVLAELQSAGLRVAEQEFSVHYATRVAHHVEILEPPSGSIASYPVLLSADTPEEGLSGELIVAGENNPAGAHVAGRIVLWMIDSRADFQTRLEQIAELRPIAILIGWPAFGVESKRQQLPEVTVRKALVPVPVFCIRFEEAGVLAAARRVHVKLRSSRFVGRTRNLIADVIGHDHPNEVIIVGAHFDTAPEIRGAIDNASGVALVLELARLYARRGSARTLRFAAWGAEKAGMVGSRHYVVAHERGNALAQGGFALEHGLAQHALCISIDGVGVRFHRDVCYASAEPGVTATLKEVAHQLAMPLVVSDSYFGSDTEMLTYAGVPGISFGQEGPALAVLHTPADDIEMIDPQRLARLGNLIDTFLMRTAATREPWPFERSAPAAAQERAANWLGAKGWSGLVPHEDDLRINFVT